MRMPHARAATILGAAALLTLPAVAGAQDAQEATFTDPAWIFDPSGNNATYAAYACGTTGEPCSDDSVIKEQADHLCASPRILQGLNADGSQRVLWQRTGGPDLRYIRADLRRTAIRPAGADESWRGTRSPGADKLGKGSEFGPAQVFTRVVCRNAALGGAGNDIRARFAVRSARVFRPRRGRRSQVLRVRTKGVFNAVSTHNDATVPDLRKKNQTYRFAWGRDRVFSGSIRLNHRVRICGDSACRRGPIRNAVVWLKVVSKGSSGLLDFEGAQRPGLFGALDLRAVVVRSQLRSSCPVGRPARVQVGRRFDEGVTRTWEDVLRLTYCGARFTTTETHGGRAGRASRKKNEIVRLKLTARSSAATPGLV